VWEAPMVAVAPFIWVVDEVRSRGRFNVGGEVDFIGR
jgi:hypothetical protein